MTKHGSLIPKSKTRLFFSSTCLPVPWYMFFFPLFFILYILSVLLLLQLLLLLKSFCFYFCFLASASTSAPASFAILSLSFFFIPLYPVMLSRFISRSVGLYCSSPSLPECLVSLFHHGTLLATPTPYPFSSTILPSSPSHSPCSSRPFCLNLAFPDHMTAQVIL